MPRETSHPAVKAATRQTIEDDAMNSNNHEYQYYILVRTCPSNPTEAVADKATAQVPRRVADLVANLCSALDSKDFHLFPQTFKSVPDEAINDGDRLCWVIGVSTLSSSNMLVARQVMSDWQSQLSTETINSLPPITGTFDAKLEQKEAFLEHALQVSWPLSALPGAKFKKAPHSSPSQVRRQFLHHTMGYGSEEKQCNPSSKLRPPKQVIGKLRHDPTYDIEDFVIGYIDRKSGILEKPVSKWGEYDLENLVAYFRQVSKDEIVWDRVKKTDHLH